MPDYTKTSAIEVRCTATDRARWQAAADQDDRTLSAWVRRTLNQVAKLEAARAKRDGQA